MPTFGSLFAGIGGMDLGLERAGWECKWQVENDEWCQRVLAKHWPDVTRFGDIRNLTERHALNPVDLICGGFPCQPVSHAGKGRAQADSRWLWPEFERIVGMVRPRYVLVENVVGLLRRGMGDVLGGLAALGYDAEWDCIPAAAFGAPHQRYRVWIVAHRQDHPQRSYSNGLGSHRTEVNEHGGPKQGRAELRDEQERFFRPLGPHESKGQHWLAEPSVGRMAPRVPNRVDRIRGIGNSVVPQVAEWIGRRLMEVA